MATPTETIVNTIFSLPLDDLRVRLISLELNISQEEAQSIISKHQSTSCDNEFVLSINSDPKSTQKHLQSTSLITSFQDYTLELPYSQTNHTAPPPVSKALAIHPSHTPVPQIPSKQSQSLPQVQSTKPIQTKQPKKHTGQDWSQLHRRRIALRFSYIGTDYGAFAYQKEEMEHQNSQANLRPSSSTSKSSISPQSPSHISTVEGELLKALKISCLIPSHDVCNYSKCGRTDRGVHGLTQVVALDIKTRWKPTSSIAYPISTIQFQQPQHQTEDYSTPGSFSCWCDIPGYIPSYSTNNDYVKTSQLMIHASTCRRSSKTTSLPTSSSLPQVPTKDSTTSQLSSSSSIQTIIPFKPHKSSLTPTPITAPLSTIRLNQRSYISAPQIRLLEDQHELESLFPILFDEIKDLPHQVAYYSTKQQPELNLYSAFEIDHFLNLRFRPWYEDLLSYYSWEESVSRSKVDAFYQSIELNSISKSPSPLSLDHTLTSSSSMFTSHTPPSILFLHPKEDPFFLSIVPHYTSPTSPTPSSKSSQISPKYATNLQSNSNYTWLFNNDELVTELSSLYTKARNFNFSSAKSPRHDNLLLSAYLLHHIQPDTTFNAQVATQNLPLLLSPISLLSRFLSSSSSSLSLLSSLSSSTSPSTNSSPTHSIIAQTNVTLLSLIHSTLSEDPFYYPPLTHTIQPFIDHNSSIHSQNSFTDSNSNLSIDKQQALYDKLTQSESSSYSQDSLLSLHDDQHWIDSQELDYIGILNRLLPSTIRIIAWAPVPPSFTARFQCDGRAYKYFFYLDQMDLCTMNIASKLFIGKHDFRNVCTMDVVSIKHFIRTVSDIAVQPVENPDIVNHLLTQQALDKQQEDQSIHSHIPMISTQHFGGHYDSILSPPAAPISSLSDNNHEITPLDTVAGLSLNIFNSNTYLATQPSLSRSRQSYIQCKNDPTNTSCRLCHVSAHSSPETLCETIIVGESFLYHQVRTMMGLLFMIGRGDESPQIISRLLDVQNNPRRPGFEFASDKGLILWECSFHSLPWKTTSVGITKGIQELHCLYREMKLQTHMVETHWRAMLPNAVHIVHQVFLKLLVPYHIMNPLLQEDLLHKQQHRQQQHQQLSLSTTNERGDKQTKNPHDIVQTADRVGFVSQFIQQYNIYMNHHHQIQQFLIANPHLLEQKQQQQQQQQQQDTHTPSETNNNKQKINKSQQSQSSNFGSTSPFGILDNKTISLYLEVYISIQSQFKAYDFTVHHFALICEWLYNLFNPQYQLNLLHSPLRPPPSPSSISTLSQPTKSSSDLSTELQLYKNILYNANNTTPYYSATPHRTNNRVLSITPFPLTHISPTLPQYTHPLSHSLVTNVLRVLSMSAFQFEIIPAPSTNDCSNIYIVLIFAHYIYTQLLQARKSSPKLFSTDGENSNICFPLPHEAVISPLEDIISRQKFPYPIIYNHVSLFQRTMEATLEEKLAKLHGVKKQRKERNLELDQVYGANKA